jgi:hypothetical protein
MQSGDYGLIENSILEKYRNDCHHIWPQANIFHINPLPTNLEQSQSSPPPPSYSSCDGQTNGGNSGTVSENQN